jgi:HEAT repeat protein
LIEFGLATFDIPEPVQVNVTPPRVVEMLVQALDAAPAAPRRVELVHDLGQCRLSSAVAPVIGAMSDPDADVRVEAVRSVAVLEARTALSRLREVSISDPQAQVRAEAIRAGAALGDPTTVAVGLNDSDDSVFVAACALATTPGHDAQIADQIARRSVSARRAAVRALGRRGSHAYAQLVSPKQANDVNDIPLLVDSIEALAKMKASSELASIQGQLAHKHPTVRRAAVLAIASLGGADVQLGVARQMLQDADASVRDAAARILAAHPAPDMLQVLFGQLDAGYPPLRESARDAIVAAASVRRELVVDSTVKLLNDGDPRRREDGSYMLGRIGADAGFERHLQLLNDPDWGVVREAAESLGHVGRLDAGPALAKLASGAGQGDRAQPMDPAQVEAIANAFVSCGRLGYGPIVPVAMRVFPEKMSLPSSIRAPAIWAAGAAGDAGDQRLAAALLRVFNDLSAYESEDARFEAVKALGNLRFAPALEELRRNAKENPVPSLGWMAHQVGDRLSGESTPYTPPNAPFVAETSIKDLGG